MMLSRPLSLVWPALLACSASDVLDRRLIYSYDNSDGQVPWSRFADVFPYLVSIQYNGNHQCGGTLIRHNWVLSAAHCFYTASTQVSKFQVWSLANATENSWNKASVDLIVVHPEYHQVTLDHDVALIRLSTSDPNASLVTLESSSARHDGKDATIAGWGSLDAACTRYEFILKEGPTQIVGSNPCVASNQFFNGTERICNEHINASGTDLSGAGCGDSGGPLFVSDGTSGMIQVGLVSYTYQGRDIFARVFTYLGWINGILASPPSSHMLVPPLCQGSCCDDPEYNDPYGQECGSYASKDCDASSTGFTDAETADLTSKCRSSCKQCPVCEATDSSCCDRVGFQSQSGKACDQFQGLDCSSDPESAEVLQNCPFTCGTCTSGTDCSDSAYFKDVKSHTCPQWKNYDCSRAVEDFSYTQADRDLVLHMCPLSCGTCTMSPTTSTTVGDGLSASISASGATSLIMSFIVLAACI